MPVIITAESQYGKELERWNTPKRMGGERPDGHLHYPHMMYVAKRAANGDPVVTYRPVANEAEEQGAIREGYVEGGRGAALEALEKRERAVGDEAAARAFRDKNMSDGAKAEVAAVVASTPEHVAEIPEKPAKRAYRRRKTTEG